MKIANIEEKVNKILGASRLDSFNRNKKMESTPPLLVYDSIFFYCLNLLSRKELLYLEMDFKKWLLNENPCGYLLSDENYEWYLNKWLNEIEDKRKENKENEVV